MIPERHKNCIGLMQDTTEVAQECRDSSKECLDRRQVIKQGPCSCVFEATCFRECDEHAAALDSDHSVSHSIAFVRPATGNR